MNKEVVIDMYDISLRDEEEYITDLCYQYNLFGLYEEFNYLELTNIKDFKSFIDELIERFTEYINDNFDEVGRRLGSKIFNINKTYRLSKEIVQFTVTPLKKDKLEVDEVKETFEICIREDFSRNLINGLIKWIGKYKYYELLQENLDEFNLIVTQVLEKEKILRSKEITINMLSKELDKLKQLDKLIYDDELDIIQNYVQCLNLLNYSLKDSIDNPNNKSSKELKEELRYQLPSNIFENFFMDKGFTRRYASKFKESMFLMYNLIVSIVKVHKKLKLDSRSISFGLGDLFIDISEKHAVIGMSEDKIKKLSTIPLFDNLEARVNSYKKALADAILYYDQPYGVVKINSNLTNELGIYSRKRLYNLMKLYANRPVTSSKARLGVSYYETKEVFAIIEKTAIGETDLININTNEPYEIMDNSNPTVDEKKNKKNKIKVTFRIKPFCKTSNQPANVSLKEIIDKSLKN